MIEVFEIPYSAVRDTELLAEYERECANKALGKPDPQWDTYAQMEAAGMLQGFAVYQDDVMAGFAGVILSILPHYGVKVATVESIFVGSHFRATRLGASLMRTIERYAQSKECKAIFYIARAGSRLEATLGKRTDRTNSVFCKALAA